MSKVRLQFKAGNTFVLTCQYTVGGVVHDLTALGITPRCQVRQVTRLVDSKVQDKALATCAVELTDPTHAIYRLSAAADVTSAWPEAILVADIKYVYADGRVASTETFEINCQREVTRKEGTA